MPARTLRSRPLADSRVRRGGPAVAIAAASLGLLVAGCGGAAARRSDATATVTAARTSSPVCAQTVRRVLGDVAIRTYDEAANGPNVVAADRRLARSRTLATAVARDDPTAARAAVRPLLKSQIQRIVVTRGARVLADVGTGAALAPVHGVIRNGLGATVGRYTMSVGRDSGIARLIHALTGAQVVMRAAGRPVVSTLPAAGHALPAARTAGVAGARSSISSFDGAAFPSGRLRVSLLFGPVDPGLCGATRAATVANTIGGIGERLLSDERGGAATARVLRIVASDPRFVRAVATNDASAVRHRIIRFFRDHTLHVVRVRAVAVNGSVVNDVGGPFVIAPASAGLRSNGRTIGRVMLSIQDDTGYIKLMRRFTRADVLLRTPAGQVPGSALSPGPSHLPRRGTVTYRGRTYQVFSFAAQAFPSGPLRISLLVPQAAGSARRVTQYGAQTLARRTARRRRTDAPTARKSSEASTAARDACSNRPSDAATTGAVTADAIGGSTKTRSRRWSFLSNDRHTRAARVVEVTECPG